MIDTFELSADDGLLSARLSGNPKGLRAVYAQQAWDGPNEGGRVGKARTATLLIVITGAYAAFALLCLTMPPASLPHSVSVLSLMGPPALLSCGGKAWPVFAGITLVLGGLLYLSLKSSSARFSAILAAAVIWVLSGYFSAALSI